jgi:hypothetical protein
MKRRATYVNRGTCDWCGVELDSDYRNRRMTSQRETSGLYIQILDPKYCRDAVKFVSPIDGSYVRARLCPEHRQKFRALIRLEEQ